MQVTACTDLTQLTDEQLQRMIDGYADELRAAGPDPGSMPMIEGALPELES